MKVMCISHEKDLNGATRSLFELINALKNKVKFYVVMPGCDGPAYEEIKKTGAEIIVMEYYRWVYTKNGEEGWQYWINRWNEIHDKKNEEVAKKLAEIVDREQIVIVHTNVGVLDIGARIKKYVNVKHIWHFREFGDLDFNMYPLVGYDSYYKTINNYSDCCIFNSKAVLNHYHDIDMNKKVLIYNGIDEEKISTFHEKHSTTNILISGFVSKEKGQKLAALACKDLINEGYSNLLLIVAGQIREEDSRELKDILPGHIEICGFVHNMNELRSRADMVLMCSQNEAFGRVTVEAMMAGVPVIGSNSGGTSEIIPTEEEGGILFDPGNKDDLKEKIKYLYDNPARREIIGKAGRKRALLCFTLKRCAQEVYECYERVSGLYSEQ